MTSPSLSGGSPLLTLQDAIDATVVAAEDSTQADHYPSTRYAAEVAWGLIYGQLRGRIPFPVPLDLLAVAVSVAIRWDSYLGNAETVKISGDQVQGFQQPQFTGFLLSELVCLWRYRIRTA